MLMLPYLFDILISSIFLSCFNVFSLCVVTIISVIVFNVYNVKVLLGVIFSHLKGLTFVVQNRICFALNP